LFSAHKHRRQRDPDGDLGRDIEVLTDMNKSRTSGFTATRDTRASFFSYVAQYRAAKILP
jgi:hypothetical protein